jgi:hypothetical protein
MLESLARVLATGGLGRGTIANACLEAFTVHVRAVMDFLYAHAPYPDDVIAEDFVPSWPANRPKCTEALAIAKARAGKEIAHLTYARLNVSREAKAWPFLEIAADVSTAFTEFLRQTPTEKLHDCWHGGVPV